MQHYLTLIFIFCTQLCLLGQYDEWDDFEEGKDSSGKEKVELVKTFHDTRVVNGHSVETFTKGTLDFRVGHRFGTIATPGAARTLFGLDQSSDIRIAFEYSILDELQIGLGRSKGYSPFSELWDGFAKYRILSQSNKMPLSLAVMGGVYFTSMRAAEDSSSMVAFQKPAHRFSYYSQVMLARNFFDYVTVQVGPGFMYRNFVANRDQNFLFSLNTALKIKIFKKFSIIGEYSWVSRENNDFLGQQYVDPLAFAVEYKTFRHSFQINVMNSGGIVEGQYIPYTSSKWLDGQFRIGFTISRQF